LFRSDQAEDRFDDPAEKAVYAKEKQTQNRGHNHYHDRGDYGFTAGRPRHTRGFSADLPNEFTGIDFGHSLFPILLKNHNARQAPGG
jgi:hypothetical protein